MSNITPLDPASLGMLEERVWRYMLMLFVVTDPDLSQEELKKEIDSITETTLFHYNSPNGRVRGLRKIYNDSINFEQERNLAARYYRDLATLVVTPRLQMACRRELREWLTQIIGATPAQIQEVLPEDLLVESLDPAETV